MPSLILGDGETAIKIEGEAIRMDSLAVQVNSKQVQKASLKITEGPSDDVLISDMPKAIRRIAQLVAQLEVVETSYSLPVGEFLTFKPAIKAWTQIGPNELLSKEVLVAYACDEHHLIVSGLFPYEGEEGEDIIVNNWVVGKVVGPKTGILTPWAMRHE